jgi:hypothetical protein
METKWLAIQSFKRNQDLIDHLNKLIVFYKLTKINKQEEFQQSDIELSKTTVASFLKRILDFTEKGENREAMMGVDSRLRSFVRSFEDAKIRRRQFRSKLFKDSPYHFISTLNNPKSKEDLDDIIGSLSELRSIIEIHNNLDLKELLEGI